ncbi:hypothetical protein BDV93DRAFT_140412 [Ceratobasidium sp. AG-I]|nr:hypothetical protein BDV93DRAFT_140412 [Ceratobasidium sp. AG-I]
MEVESNIKDESLSRRERDDRDDRDRRDRRDRDRSRSRDRDREHTRDRDRRDDRRRGDDDRRRRRDRTRSRSRSRSRRRSTSPGNMRGSRRRRSRSRSRDRGGEKDRFARSLGGPINADADEAAEMSKNSKKENRVYVGNLSYDVKYGDLMEFMRGGGWMMDFGLGLVFGGGFSWGFPGGRRGKGYGDKDEDEEECGIGSWRGLSASRPPSLSPPLFYSFLSTGRA